MTKQLPLIICIAFVAAHLQAAEEKKTNTATNVVLSAAPATTATDKEQKNKVSYAIGMSIGHSLRQNGYDFNVDELIAGIKGELDGKPKIPETEAQQIFQNWQRDDSARRSVKRKQQTEDNKKKAEAFLAGNAKKPGVKTTDSGLQYKVIKEGSGKKPTREDFVKVFYRGRLTDGMEFENTFTNKEPSTVPVTGVIPGWTEALLMMPVGSKWELYIPPALAYGEMGQRKIPGNAVLIFEIELVGVKEPEKPTLK